MSRSQIFLINRSGYRLSPVADYPNMQGCRWECNIYEPLVCSEAPVLIASICGPDDENFVPRYNVDYSTGYLKLYYIIPVRDGEFQHGLILKFTKSKDGNVQLAKDEDLPLGPWGIDPIRSFSDGQPGTPAYQSVTVVVEGV